MNSSTRITQGIFNDLQTWRASDQIKSIHSVHTADLSNSSSSTAQPVPTGP